MNKLLIYFDTFVYSLLWPFYYILLMYEEFNCYLIILKYHKQMSKILKRY